MAVVGDRGYDADGLREHWRERGIATCVPVKRNRVVQHDFNKALYRTRRMSLRLDKTDASFRIFACLAAAILNRGLKVKLCQ